MIHYDSCEIVKMILLYGQIWWLIWLIIFSWQINLWWSFFAWKFKGSVGKDLLVLGSIELLFVKFMLFYLRMFQSFILFVCQQIKDDHKIYCFKFRLFYKSNWFCKPIRRCIHSFLSLFFYHFSSLAFMHAL